jgi:hypothetical protein
VQGYFDEENGLPCFVEAFLACGSAFTCPRFRLCRVGGHSQAVYKAGQVAQAALSISIQKWLVGFGPGERLVAHALIRLFGNLLTFYDSFCDTIFKTVSP